MLAIIDYQAGNLTSVRRALDFLDIPNVITADPETIAQARGIIFPGVGAAGSAMANLTGSTLDTVLREQVALGKPLLGICLGCQVILDKSEENRTTTLGLVPGECVRFTEDLTDEQGLPINIPHMGWNSVALKKECLLFEGVDEDAEFYFVHAFYPNPDPAYVLGVTGYGREFCSVLGRDGLWAMQFHPEKSGRPGLKILENFSSYCKEVTDAQ